MFSKVIDLCNHFLKCILNPKMNCFRVDKKENRLLDFFYSNSVRHAKECIALQKLSVALRLKAEILVRKGYGLDDRYNSLCYITNRHYTISYCGHYGILV